MAEARRVRCSLHAWALARLLVLASPRLASSGFAYSAASMLPLAHARLFACSLVRLPPHRDCAVDHCCAYRSVYPSAHLPRSPAASLHSHFPISPWSMFSRRSSRRPPSLSRPSSPSPTLSLGQRPGLGQPPTTATRSPLSLPPRSRKPAHNCNSVSTARYHGPQDR
ncbi:hypothetical protein B0H67DRAFT_58504 [Lasiosphaeris hirsuta]|uniref:Secreted protein n=1 Tax=Lasiosphaeris hirsuta TaxID=260670 RepID=A0AA40BB79_9PEZI|nr:hypothetical protein B0H67DRAFT_58504 [Lasiosphaeris hirsuta]